MNFRGMAMDDIEERALDKKLVGKAKDDFLERQKSKYRKDVAIKKMRLADDTDLERVLGLTIREAEFLAELNHPNIIELEGFVEVVSEGIIWLVFPWSWDGNLKEFVAKEKWEIPERISLISDVAKGLEYLHTRSPPICHGDLKSLNVLVYDYCAGESDDWRIYARLTDFGSARRLPRRDPNIRIEEIGTQLPSVQPPTAAFRPSSKTITLTGNRYTLRWAAPELLLQDQLSLWSDIWALGWIAYEVMTGSLPFEDATSEMAIVEGVLDRKLPSLRDNADLMVIHELCSLMNECWEVQPTQRPTADSCRRSIEKMPMFAPEMEEDGRVLSLGHLHQLRQIYESRGEHTRVFILFADALDPETGPLVGTDRIQGLRDLAELARLREEYSETIAVYDVIWKLYEWNGKQDTDGLADAFWDLAELHRLQEESEKTGELRYEGQKTQERQRVTMALCAMAEMHRRKGRLDRAIQLNSNALKISQDLTDREGRADALWGLAEAHRLQDEYEEAIQVYSEVLDIRTDLGDRKGRADALWGVAEVHRLRSEYGEAIPLYSEVSEIRSGFGDRKGRADALWGLAEVHRLRSEYKEAIPLYSEVSGICSDFGDRKGRADALCVLADVHWLRNDYEKAIQVQSELLKLRTDLRDEEGRAGALWCLADLHRSRSEYDEAIRFYCDCLKSSAYFSSLNRSIILSDLADVHRLRRNHDMAIPLYSNTLKFSILLGNKKGIAGILRELADKHRLRSEWEEAIQVYSEVLEISTDLGSRQCRADALWGLAEVHRLRSKYEEATPLYYEVSKIHTDLGDPKGRADALLGLADVRRRRREYEEAIPLTSEVLEIFTYFEDKRRAWLLNALAEMHLLRYEYDKAIPLYRVATMLFIDAGDMAGRDAALSGFYSCL